jgi:hypothetical protein
MDMVGGFSSLYNKMDNDKCITTDEIAKAFGVKPTCDNMTLNTQFN